MMSFRVDEMGVAPSEKYFNFILVARKMHVQTQTKNSFSNMKI